MDNLQLIQSKIYEIRRQKVMLDRDLAELYQVTTGNLNKAVKRNLKRFPPDFMFQLTVEKWEALRFQIGILKNGRGEHTKYLPYAFTEQGLAMLSGILNSDAIENYIEEVFSDYNDINNDTRIQLELINQTLAELQTKDRGFKERKQIGYKLPGCEEDDKTKY